MKVLIAGDFCDKHRVSNYIANRDYSSLFGNVKQIVSNADVSIVNFEFPIVCGNGGKPIVKNGPNLKGQIESIGAIQYSGFNVCTLANNHILDQGETCCLETKRLLEEAGIKTVGIGDNINAASSVLYIKVADKQLAIINCCENEYSIATEKSAGANPLNPIRQHYMIREARTKADYVLVIVHGGHEMFQYPSPRMKETYRFFIDSGADAVINHHQHCYSGYEVYKGHPIFYGLGNLLFDNLKTDSIWNEGYMVMLSMSDSISFELYPYRQCDKSISVDLLSLDEQQKFFSHVAEINNIIQDDALLQHKVSEYYQSCSQSELRRLETYPGKLLRYLNRKGILPDLVRGKVLYSILNHIECESHRDKLIYALKDKK